MNAASTNKRVIIIGAGPAGLACAACLGARDIPYLLLEKGPIVSTALRQVDPDMTLLSPTSLSLLPGMELTGREPDYLPFSTLVKTLERYQERQGIKVITNASVESVARAGEGFEVRYRSEDGERRIVEGSHVVNATGIISNPQLPENFDPASCSFRWLHSLDVRAEDLAAARRLLVVGGGASSAEVFERWLDVRQPEDHAWLSLRSSLLAFPHWILGIDIHYFVWLPEQIPTCLFGWRAGRLHEPMTGLAVVRAVNKGLVTRVSGVSKYEGDGVTLDTGQRLKPDLVVFATGFRYSTKHLGQLLDYDPDARPRVINCESTRTRGLYLLGYRFARTFASPYLRGIARDAEYVANRIAGERNN